MSLITRKYKEHIVGSKIDRILSLINSGELNLERCQKKNNITQAELNEQIKKALLTIKKKLKNDYTTVLYSYTVPNFGRVYAKSPYGSIGNLPREIRGTLANDYYIDIDINNCHPVLLVQLCDKYGIECSELRKYVNNRDEYLHRIINEYNCTRDDAKVLFLELMYGGSYDSWAKSINTTKSAPVWLLSLINNIKKVYPKLLEHYQAEINLLAEYGKPEKEYNREAAIVSWILQDTECQILNVMIEYLSRYGKSVSNCVLCFDGFMMLKDKYTPKLLVDLEAEVKKKTNFIIKLSTKPFTTIELPECDNIDDDDYTAPVTENFDLDVFNTCSYKSWNAMKEYFERFACYNEDGDNIAFYNADKGEIEFITNKARRDRFANCFDHINLKDNKDNSPTNFIDNWMKCINRKRSHKINCIPYSGTFKLDRWCVNGTINTFKGFNKLIDIVDESHREDFNNFYNNYFLKLLFNLCEQNDEYSKWVLQFFAQMVQHPEERVRRALIFVGNQGDGKNVILETIVKVLGDQLFNSSSKPKDYFGDIACAHFNKILVNLDESRKSGNLDLEGMIKEFVTKAVINVRQMYKDTFTADNYARLVVTTNNSAALPIDFNSGDRRFVIFRTNNPYKSVNSDEYIQFWNEYIDFINQDWFPGLMYEQLMKVDISDWNQNKEIRSKQYEDTREMCGNSVDWFFNDMCFKIYDKAINNKTKPCCIRSSDLYDDYKEWCSDNGVDKPISSKYFKPNIIDNITFGEFTTWHKFKDANYFKFDVCKLKEYANTLVEDPSDNEDNDVWDDTPAVNNDNNTDNNTDKPINTSETNIPVEITSNGSTITYRPPVINEEDIKPFDIPLDIPGLVKRKL